MSLFNILFIAAISCFFIGRVTNMIMFTRLPEQYRAGFYQVMNPFGRDGFIQLVIVLILIALVLQFTTISPIVMGIVQIVLTAAIFTFRHIEVHKILGETNLPRRYSSLFWVSRIFTLVSFMAFF